MTSLQRIAYRWFTATHGQLWENPARAGWRTAHFLPRAGAAGPFVRRICGSFQPPPPGLVLASVGVAGTAWCAALPRLGPLCGLESLQPPVSWLLFGLLSLACLLLLLAV